MTDVTTAEKSAPDADASLPLRLIRIARFARAHWPFAIVLIAGITIRVIATLGYPSVGWFGDSATYLVGSLYLVPSVLRPSGYSIFLWLLKPAHSLTVVVISQHVMGVVTGVMIYASVWRGARALGVRRTWQVALPATLAAVPVLLDAYLIQLEQMLMADTLFLFLMVAAITMALWRQRLSWWMGAVAGLIMGLAAVTKSAGLPLIIVVVVCLLVRRAGWRAITASVAVFAVPMVAYGFWFQSTYGKFAFTNTDQIYLYGRTVDFANCSKMKPPLDVAVLCMDGVWRDPQIAAPGYQALWGQTSGLRQIPDGLGGDEANRRAGVFAWLAITTQPGDYVKVVWRDTFRAFEWDRKPYPTQWTVDEYLFAATPQSLEGTGAWAAYEYGGWSTWEPKVIEPYAGWMRGYQSWAYLRGTYLGIILLLGLGGMIARWRRWGGLALLPWLMSVALLVIPAATADFDYRYVMPAMPFAMLAAGLALTWSGRKATEPAAD